MPRRQARGRCRRRASRTSATPGSPIPTATAGLEPLGTNPGYVQSIDDALVLFPPGSALTYAQCKAATRVVHQIPTDQLDTGAQICVTTVHHRIALLKVTHIPSATGEANAYISFDATVWQGPLS